MFALSFAPVTRELYVLLGRCVDGWSDADDLSSRTLGVVKPSPVVDGVHFVAWDAAAPDRFATARAALVRYLNDDDGPVSDRALVSSFVDPSTALTHAFEELRWFPLSVFTFAVQSTHGVLVHNMHRVETLSASFRARARGQLAALDSLAREA